MTARLLPVGIFVCLFRETLESDPLYSDLWLEGEISDLSRSAAGHTYFSLRDEDGALKCVLFRNQALRQHQVPRFGQLVSVHGGLSIYPRSGAMQLVVDLVRPAGLGAATLELEYLRQRLKSEGIFDPERKRPLPPWPRTIGVVTSAHGAAWHDIQSIVGRRYPLAALVLAPALVQGLGAAESIVEAIEAVQIDTSIDIVILARGGGANEDLAAFNDERVVRAVFACRVPVVTGVGHATDRTLVEDVADAFAATPSEAAEVCVPSRFELHDRVSSLQTRLSWSMAATTSDVFRAVTPINQRLVANRPEAIVDDHRAAVRIESKKLVQAISSAHCQSGQSLETARKLLLTLDPAAILRRGYAALKDPVTDRPVFSVSQLSAGSAFEVVMTDGSVDANAERVTSISARPASAS